MSKINDGGPVFPQNIFEHNGEKTFTWSWGYGGLSKRDWFATFAPEPTTSHIEDEGKKDQLANPHGDNYKPARRSWEDIRVDLRYRYADAMIAANQREPR